MKILIASDLHVEFSKHSPLPSIPEVDVIVAAGDINIGGKSPKTLVGIFGTTKPIIYVPGNHDSYSSDINEDAKRYAADDRVITLNPGVTKIDDVTFIGATMWSDLKLRGYYDVMDYEVERAIADFRVIRDGTTNFTAEKMRKIHESEKQFVIGSLSEKPNDKTVVITHFVPTQMAIHERFVGDRLNPYFINDHDEMMGDFGYPLHIFGHTHDRYDFIHPYGTRVVGNPRGYPGERSEPFEWKVVEL